MLDCMVSPYHEVVQKKDSADELWDVLEVNAEFASFCLLLPRCTRCEGAF